MNLRGNLCNHLAGSHSTSSIPDEAAIRFVGCRGTQVLYAAGSKKPPGSGWLMRKFVSNFRRQHVERWSCLD